tara:strand:- start:623 stop:1237 length:615 start_codon:yes stop_codon:yes gene_type:complete
MKKICILDYGLGNVRSLFNSLKKINCEPDLFSTSKKKNYDFIFIPGVGSYNTGSELLMRTKIKNFLFENLKNSKIFGICLGMQLLFSEGIENGYSKGLNLVNGNVKKIKSRNEKLILPFVGYQSVKFKFNNFPFLEKYNNCKFYFVHSYEAVPKESDCLLATTTRGKKKYCASVVNKNIIGTQFHPEKSGEIGLEFLKDVIKNF